MFYISPQTPTTITRTYDLPGLILSPDQQEFGSVRYSKTWLSFLELLVYKYSNICWYDSPWISFISKGPHFPRGLVFKHINFNSIINTSLLKQSTFIQSRMKEFEYKTRFKYKTRNYFFIKTAETFDGGHNARKNNESSVPPPLHIPFGKERKTLRNGESHCARRERGLFILTPLKNLTVSFEKVAVKWRNSGDTESPRL